MDAVQEAWQVGTAWFEHYPMLEMVAGLAILLVIAVISNYILKRVLIRTLISWLRRFSTD